MRLLLSEPGCAPIETFIAVLEDEPKRFQTKVLLPLANVKQADVEASMPAKDDWATGKSLSSSTFHSNGISGNSKLTVLDIEGMMCQETCGLTVENALQLVDGVEMVEVVFEKKKARVSGAASVEMLVAAIKNVGFAATLPITSGTASLLPQLNPSGDVLEKEGQKSSSQTGTRYTNAAVPGGPAHLTNPNIKCTCGCVPNIPSMFEMAALRKKYQEEQKRKKAEAEQRGQ
jgi:copper chaperone CopZ